MKLISKHEENNYAEYIFEYKGYTIKETCYAEDDCTHHSARVLKDNAEITRFNWLGCLEQAKKYIDEVSK